MIKIRSYKRSDAHGVAQVISTTYAEFNRNEGSKKAVKEYIDYFSPKKSATELHETFQRTPIHFVATDHSKIIGMVRGHKDRITNLFVLGTYQGKGIGKLLLETFEKTVRRKGSTYIKVRASLYATNFYSRNGYIKTTGIRKIFGVKNQPMIKRF